MHAPSPVCGSAPWGPRCSRLTSAVIALSTMSRLRRPCMSATMATPHASCSNAGLYRPCARVGVLPTRAGGPPARRAGGEQVLLLLLGAIPTYPFLTRLREACAMQPSRTAISRAGDGGAFVQHRTTALFHSPQVEKTI